MPPSTPTVTDRHLESLNDAGPLRPDAATGHWPVHNPFDAIDALDLSCPAGFDSGVLVLILDDHHEPIVSLAVRNAPPDGLDPIVSLLLDAREDHNLASVVFGIVRPGHTDTVGSVEDLIHWMNVAQRLDDCGIDVLDVLTLDESCWSSVALTMGELSYPDTADARLRWFEGDPCGDGGTGAFDPDGDRYVDHDGDPGAGPDDERFV